VLGAVQGTGCCVPCPLRGAGRSWCPASAGPWPHWCWAPSTRHPART